MPHEPQVEARPEQRYLAIRRQVTDGVPAAVDAAFPALFRWLGEHGVPPAGIPFIRVLEVDAAGEPLELEVAVPVAGDVPGEAGVRADRLPAGRYATLLHVGPYRSTTEPDLAAARATLQAWAEREGLALARRDTERGSALRAYAERYLTGPVDEPDHAKWQTELAYLVAEN